MQSILRVFTVFVIIGVNLLSISITCFSPSLGSDGHQHTLFHLFERNTSNHSDSHPDSGNAQPHDDNCSLHAHTAMTVLPVAPTCDLCTSQDSVLVESNDDYQSVSLNPITLLRRDSLSPPEEPPELS